MQEGSSDSSEGFVLKYNLNQHLVSSQGSESVEQSAISHERHNLFFENIIPRKRKLSNVCRTDTQSYTFNSKVDHLAAATNEGANEDLESTASIQDEFDLINRQSQFLLSQYSTVSQKNGYQAMHTDTYQIEIDSYNDMHSSGKHFEYQKATTITELPMAQLNRNLKLKTFCEMKQEKYDILTIVLQVSKIY